MKHFSFTRRAFIQQGTSLAALAALPRHRSIAPTRSTGISSARGALAQTDPDGDRVRALLLRAVDAAKSAGAAYADARAVRIIDQKVAARRSEVTSVDYHMTAFERTIPAVDEYERHAISVRALVNGAWGFTATPWWTDDDASTIAQAAVAQARDNAQWTTSRIELAPAPAVTGSWTTPYRIDPFSIPLEEKMAVMDRAYHAYRPLYRNLEYVTSAYFLELSCQHTMRALATSEGTFITQHFYTTTLGRRMSSAQLSGLSLQTGRPEMLNHWGDSNGGQDYPVPPGIGWEVIADTDFWTLGRQGAERMYQDLIASLEVRPKAVDVGQYTIVMDADTVGRLVDITIGRASDFDRIIGDETNAGGTTYLGTDPLQLLGTYSFGSPLVSVRTTKASAVGTVRGLPAAQWDDEGVPHVPLTLVKDGVLQDLPTTRDRATMLAPYYQKRGRAVASNGCSVSGSDFGLDLPTVGPPTLVLEPGPRDATLDAMISSVPKGMLLTGGQIETDFQFRQLAISGTFHEIVNGRLGRQVLGAIVLIDAPQLWKNLTTLGSVTSAQVALGSFTKGVPAESIPTTVVAVPGIFKEMPVVNGARRQ